MITWSGARLCASLTWDCDVLTDEVHALRWLIAHTGLAIGGAGAADRFNLAETATVSQMFARRIAKARKALGALCAARDHAARAAARPRDDSAGRGGETSTATSHRPRNRRRSTVSHPPSAVPDRQPSYRAYCLARFVGPERASPHLHL